MHPLAVGAGVSRSLAARMVATGDRRDAVGRAFVVKPRDDAERDVVQLASLRDALATRGLARVARSLTAAGIGGVEVRPFAEPGVPAALPELAARLRSEGLTIVSWLVPYHAADARTLTLARDAERLVDLADASDVRYLGTASAPNRHGVGADAIRRAAEDFSRVARLAAERGIRFVYHHHVADFAIDPASGERLFDILLTASSPEVGIELDLHWAAAGTRLNPGADPLAHVRRRPDRFPIFHAHDGAFDLEAAAVAATARPARTSLRPTLATPAAFERAPRIAVAAG